MKTIEFGKSDFRSLNTIAKKLIHEFSNELQKDVSYHDLLSENGTVVVVFDQIKDVQKIGAFYGFKGSTLFNKQSQEKISLDNLRMFQEKIENLNKRDSKNEKLKQYAREASIIINKAKERQKVKEYKAKPNKRIIELFENQTYLIYERYHNKFSRQILQFQNFENEKLKVEIKIAEEGIYPFTGFAYCDTPQNRLIISTHNGVDENSMPTYYMLRVEGTISNFEILVGHVSFFSKVKNSIVSKTVVLQHISQEEALKISAQDFSLEEGKRIENIPEGIYKFLYKRRLNRLPSPSSTLITNLTSLDEWHEANEQEKKDSINENLSGAYNIYYKRNLHDNDLSMDHLVIKEDFFSDIVAHYFHRIENGQVQEWYGKIPYLPDAKTVAISFAGPIKQKKLINKSPIFLILNLPWGERNFSVLTGIVSGIADSYTNSVGFLITAVKQENNNIEDSKSNIKKMQGSEIYPTRASLFLDNEIIEPIKNLVFKKDEKEYQKVLNFFTAYSHRCQILPPKTPITNFDELKKCIGEANDEPDN